MTTLPDVKFVFLDIDGVLNRGLVKSASPASDIIERSDGWMNRSRLTLFNDMIAHTGAGIVVSSSWRRANFAATRRSIKAFGVTGMIVSQTPDLGPQSSRGDEITQWLSQYTASIPGRTVRYIILDDVNDLRQEQQSRLVLTDPHEGFDRQAFDRCVMLLNTPQTLINDRI